MKVVKKWEWISRIIAFIYLVLFVFSAYTDMQIYDLIINSKEGADIFPLYFFFSLGGSTTVAIAYLLYMQFKRVGD